MTLGKTRGMVCTRMGIDFEKEIVIRAERTNNFVTVSLSDESREIMMQVPYDAIKKVVRDTYK